MNNPLFAGNPQLQEQLRHQLPVFLQQVRPTLPFKLTIVFLSLPISCCRGKDQRSWMFLLDNVWPSGLWDTKYLSGIWHIVFLVWPIDAESWGPVCDDESTGHAGPYADPAGTADPSDWVPWTHAQVRSFRGPTVMENLERHGILKWQAWNLIITHIAA